MRSQDRVRQAAADAGLDILIRDMPQSTRTAEEAAEACGCDVAQIVKSLIFKRADNNRPVLLLVSGANRVDMDKVAGDIGATLKRRLSFSFGRCPMARSGYFRSRSRSCRIRSAVDPAA